EDEQFRFDPAGNRTSANGNNYSLESTGDNRINSDGLYDYQYDAEGNLTRKALHSDTNVYTTYEWDYRNRLTVATVHSYSSDVYGDDSNVEGYPAVQVFYVYDAFDRLVYRFRRTGYGGDPVADDDEWGEAYVYDQQSGQLALRFSNNQSLLETEE